MSAVDQVRALVLPIVEDRSAELYDIEYESGVVRIYIDSEGGIDVDTVGELSRLISDALDRDDPIPDSRYLLEVSSPGVERKLRTSEHFSRQIGETAAIKLRAPMNGVRRFQATVVSVDGDSIELVNQETNESLVILIDGIESAHSVFDWSLSPEDKPSDKPTDPPESQQKVAAQ